MVQASVLIAERNPDGHRLMFVALLAEEAIRKGHRVTLWLGFDVEGNDQYSVHLGTLSKDVVVVDRRKVDLADLKAAAVKLSPDHIVVPDGDAVAIQLGRSLGWRARSTLTLLILRDPAAELGRSIMRRAKLRAKNGFLVRAAACKRVRVFRLRSASTQGASPDGYVADPVVTQHTTNSVRALRGHWNLNSNVFWFGVVGAITGRKNIPLVVAALYVLKGSNVGLLVAGLGSDEESDRALERLRADGVHVVRVNRVLTNLEIDSAVACVDCVVLLHSNEGPSGILGKAAAAGTRVVSGGAHSLQVDTTAMGLGAWVDLRTDEVVRAFEDAMLSKRPMASPDLSASEFKRLIS